MNRNFIFILFFYPILIFAQYKADNEMLDLKLDTVSITHSGFTVEDFIRMTKTDTSFYRAFKNLRVYPHKAQSNIIAYQKKGKEKGEMNRVSQLKIYRKKSFIEIISEKTNGKFYNKKGEHIYYTAAMFDKVFFPKDSFDLNNVVGQAYRQKQPVEKTREEKHYEQLKTFIFSPGTGVEGVPIIGKNLDVFDGKTRKFYDFTISKVSFKDSVPCYLFSVQKKKTVKDSKITIEYIHTYYDRRTMNIIARNYRIIDNTVLFSFDITIKIELDKIKNEYVPLLIQYQGEWDIPLKLPERMYFKKTMQY